MSVTSAKTRFRPAEPRSVDIDVTSTTRHRGASAEFSTRSADGIHLN